MSRSVMRTGHLQWLRLLGLALAGVLVAATPAAARDELASTVESDCAEVGVNRAAGFQAAQALVPSRYTLLKSGTGAARLVFVDYRCSSLAVDGHPPARDATVSFVGYEITARDGEPTDYLYLVAIATNHPVLYARYRNAGLPVEFDPRTESSEYDNAAGARAMSWTIVGDGLSHTLTVVPNEPATAPLTETTGMFWFDGPRGDLRLSFENELRPSSTAIITSGDFTGASAVRDLFAAPRFLTLTPGTSVRFDRGSWTGLLERVPPPDALTDRTD